MKPAIADERLIFYEDIEPGEFLLSPPETIDRHEMLSFARKWDPLPIHVDEDAAIKVLGSLTAPGLYILAVKLRLIHKTTPIAVIASLGFDEVRFHLPLRPDDTVTLTQRWVSRRPSSSKPDRGVVAVQYFLKNQREELVMSWSCLIWTTYSSGGVF